jgi:hypothetical protein
LGHRRTGLSCKQRLLLMWITRRAKRDARYFTT